MNNSAKIHLVGSVPCNSASEVFELCGETIGDYLYSIPDGETGYRRYYIGWLGYSIYRNHPDLEVVRKPLPIDPNDPNEWRKPGQEWLSRETDRSDFWSFRIRDGVDQLQLETLGYADAAVESYEEFVRLRDADILPKSLRFQVSLPSAIDGAGAFAADPQDLPKFISSYERAMSNDISKMLEVIPASDLAIQWDNVGFVIGHEMERAKRRQAGTDSIEPSALTERFRQAIGQFMAKIPDDASFGIHFCYGDFGHQHALQPHDLSVSVFLANEALSLGARTIDWVHMPVPRDRDDDAYFRPLADMRDDTRLFLGVVHHTDGIEGTNRRIEVAKRFHSDFGIATECGFGRRPDDQLPELLNIHRQAATHL